MASSLTTRQSEEPVHGLLVKEDDYSIQVETPVDPMFWIRIERTASPPVIISDLKKSNLPIDVVGAALNIAVGACELGGPVANLRFLDIAPGGDERRAEEEAAGLAAIIVEYARLRNQRVLSIKRLTRRSKTDLAVLFE